MTRQTITMKKCADGRVKIVYPDNRVQKVATLAMARIAIIMRTSKYISESAVINFVFKGFGRLEVSDAGFIKGPLFSCSRTIH